MGTQNPPAADLLSLIGGRFRHVARTRGGEYAGACPGCGGNDRFRVWPNATRPAWWCRGCNKGGDAIQFLREFEGLSYHEAVERLGGAAPAGEKKPVPPVAYEEAPPEPWQERARVVAAAATRRLWSAEGEGAMRYLRERRGLTDESIRRAGLGLIPATDFDTEDRWGLSDGKKVWLPKGIAIPYELGGAIWQLKIRRPRPADGDLAAHIGPATDKAEGKYAAVRGSRPALYGLESVRDREHGFYVEGEFDALLLHQQAGDLIAAFTIGSASTLPSGRWLWALRGLGRIFLAFDPDSAGKSGAEAALALSARMRIAQPIGGDVTEMHLAGGDLRTWVRYHLAREMPTVHDELPTLCRCGGPVHIYGRDGEALCERCHGGGTPVPWSESVSEPFRI
jgi:hypothetical protein